MRVLARLLLVWLIALALPIQGVAGVTMLHCGPSHHAPPAEAPHAEGGHAHHQHAVHAGAVDGQHDHGHTAALGHAHHAADKASCSACAACCAGTALAVPMTPLVLALQDVAQEHAPAAEARLAAFLTGGPERPPRPSLA